jgi:hypothetical protein
MSILSNAFKDFWDAKLFDGQIEYAHQISDEQLHQPSSPEQRTLSPTSSPPPFKIAAPSVISLLPLLPQPFQQFQPVPPAEPPLDAPIRPSSTSFSAAAAVAAAVALAPNRARFSKKVGSLHQTIHLIKHFFLPPFYLTLSLSLSHSLTLGLIIFIFF